MPKLFCRALSAYCRINYCKLLLLCGVRACLLLIVLTVNLVHAQPSISGGIGPMVIKTMPPESDNDLRHAYKIRVIKAALDATIEQYGPYVIQTPSYSMNSLRAFNKLMLRESDINTVVGLPTKQREMDAIPIRIPIRRGLLNYRLMLVRNADLQEFQNIRTAEQLKTKSVGMAVNWLTADVMKRQGYTIVYGTERDTLYNMLAHGRFDYMLLGVNEAYKEVEHHSLGEQGISIVPGVAVYINMPSYIFVSKHEPLIAKRIRDGLEIMQGSGELHVLFEQEYGEYIQSAKLSERHIIKIHNPTLPDSIKLIEPEYWLDVQRAAASE